MAFLEVKNRSISSLASGVSDTETSWTVTTEEGSKFPASGDFHITCEDEIVKCTARSGDVLTVTRAQEGTSAASHDAGQSVELRVTAGIIENIQNEIYSHSQDTDFNKYKAIALVCDNGATIPASPATGQWFLHIPAGRKVLMQYDGSSWIPIISFGPMTLYVDATDGTDDQSHGTGVDSDAFATIQYAVDTIPGLVGGNVEIFINNESYAESVAVGGKSFTGDYSITFNGTLNQQSMGTIESAVQGSGATQGSITDVGEFGGYDNMLVYANLEYRIIDSDTSGTLTICGCFTGTPSGTWIVYDWGTDVNAIQCRANQVRVFVYDIEINNENGLSNSEGAYTNAYRCKLNQGYHFNGSAYLENCFITDTDTLVGRNVAGYAYVRRSKILGQIANVKILRVDSNGKLAVQYGTVIDGGSYSGSIGMYCIGGSACNTWSTAAEGYVRIRNCSTGIRAQTGAIVENTSSNQYSGNTTDEDAVSASYGYID